jgi:hypothetical protein
MTYTIENKVLKKIYTHGRDWAFSEKDFASLANRSAIDVTLHRLMNKGTIRRVLRGIYDYPKFSKLLQKQLSPDIDKVAQAIARKHGWRIQPSGPVSLNILGLSTQVPSKYVYLSDGPTRSFQVGKTKLSFKATVLKEAGFRYHESSIIVAALRSLGKDHVTSSTSSVIRSWLDPNMRIKVLKDTNTVSRWIYDVVRQVCEEDVNG